MSSPNECRPNDGSTLAPLDDRRNQRRMGRTVTSLDLVLRNDDLHGIALLRAWNRSLQQADAPDDLPFFNNPDLPLFPTSNLRSPTSKVIRASNHQSRLGDLLPTLNADELAGVGVGDDVVNGLVEHVGPAVDGGETGEGLGELAEAVEGVDVGGFAVASHGRGVEDDSVVGWAGGLGLVARGKKRGGMNRQLVVE
jgi:hypothetical protein